MRSEPPASFAFLLGDSRCSFLRLVVFEESLSLYGIVFKIFQYFSPVACRHFLNKFGIKFFLHEFYYFFFAYPMSAWNSSSFNLLQPDSFSRSLEDYCDIKSFYSYIPLIFKSGNFNIFLYSE